MTVGQIVYVVQGSDGRISRVLDRAPQEVRNASVYCKLPLQSFTNSFVFLGH